MSQRPRGIGSAAAIFDPRGDVLLVKHTYGRLNWELPGGLAEPDESPVDTVIREVREETSLTVTTTALTGYYYEPAEDLVHFVFLCERVALGANPAPASEEISECGWFALEALPYPISDFTVRRIRDAADGTTLPLPGIVGARHWIDSGRERAPQAPLRSTCSVRELRPDEAEAWASLRRQALTAHPLAFGSSIPDDPNVLIELIQARLTSDESTVFGAFAETRLIGILGVYRQSGKKERHKASIWGMYVTPAGRRQGAGGMLLRRAIDEARSWPGVEQLHLSVSEVAADARRLYERHGFRAWGREPRALCWEDRAADETHMIANLR